MDKKGDNMDIESIKTFITLAEIKNYTKTAQIHMVVQSTVSKRIHELETEVGKVLFSRDKKGLELTKAGEHFLLHARQMADIQKHMISEMNRLDKFSGYLYIGAVQSFNNRGLPGYIMRYYENHPDVSIRIYANHSNDLLNMLYDGKIDVGFTYKATYDPGCEYIPFLKDRIVLVASPKLNIYPDGIDKEELKNLNIFYSNTAISTRGWFENIFGKNFHFTVSVDVGTALIPYLMECYGYGFVSENSVERELAEGKLSKIRIIDEKEPEFWVYMVSRKKRNAITDEFIKLFQQYAEEENSNME